MTTGNTDIKNIGLAPGAYEAKLWFFYRKIQKSFELIPKVEQLCAISLANLKEILTLIKQRLDELCKVELDLIIVTNGATCSIREVEQQKHDELKDLGQEVKSLHDILVGLIACYSDEKVYLLHKQVEKSSAVYSSDDDRHQEKIWAYEKEILREKGSYEEIQAVRALREEILRGVHETEKYITQETHQENTAEPIMGHVMETTRERNGMSLSHQDVERVTNLLAKMATCTRGSDPKLFFVDLVRRADIPQSWINDSYCLFHGHPNADARNLILWAINQGTNTQDPRYTALGSLLQPLLPNLGLEDVSSVVALIITYKLFNDRDLLQNLILAYQVPYLMSDEVIASGDISKFVGPHFDWRGPEADVDLQAWFAKPPMLDVGFIKRAMDQSRSICRIESPENNFLGTGFLIGQKNLLLTNYHVFKLYENDDLDANIRNAILRFGCFTTASGDTPAGRTFKPNLNDPVVSMSPTNDLDFILLRVEENIIGENTIQALTSWSLTPPAPRSSLHILQHPEGEAMKLALADNAVTGVYDKSRIQYCTPALHGSSGAPCFNDEWQVVALHHAERSKTWGSVREGILFEPIYNRIYKFL